MRRDSHPSLCGGGGGTTAVVANNVLYSLMGEPANGIYVNATTGAQLGTFTADVVPAISPTTGFFLKSGTLNAKSLSDNSSLWSFQVLCGPKPQGQSDGPRLTNLTLSCAIHGVYPELLTNPPASTK
jgi:hypothetical protein